MIGERLMGILAGLGLVYQRFHMPLILPVHPRTRNQIRELGLVVPEGVRYIDPVGFLDFLALESKAAVVLTDSGGVKMEAYVLHIPCVTLRETTVFPLTR